MKKIIIISLIWLTCLPAQGQYSDKDEPLEITGHDVLQIGGGSGCGEFGFSAHATIALNRIIGFEYRVTALKYLNEFEPYNSNSGVYLDSPVYGFATNISVPLSEIFSFHGTVGMALYSVKSYSGDLPNGRDAGTQKLFFGGGMTLNLSDKYALQFNASRYFGYTIGILYTIGIN